MSNQVWLKNYPVRWNLEYPEISLYNYLKQQTSSHMNLVALVYQGNKVTYEEMYDKIDRFAAALSDLGIQKSDRVALMMPNCPEYVYAYYACMKIGAVEVQVDPLSKSDELELVIRDCEPQAIIVADLVVDSIIAIKNKVAINNLIIVKFSDDHPNLPGVLRFEDLVRRYAADSKEAAISPKDDVAVLQYTGGTTGMPKAAMLTHYNIVCNIMQKREWFSDWLTKKYSNGTKQLYGLAVMPFFHATGHDGGDEFWVNRTVWLAVDAAV
jgi:long-chain acyl-CoA synthetase